MISIAVSNQFHNTRALQLTRALRIHHWTALQAGIHEIEHLLNVTGVSGDGLSYNQTPFLIQNTFTMRRAFQDPEGVRFQDYRLYDNLHLYSVWSSSAIKISIYLCYSRFDCKAVILLLLLVLSSLLLPYSHYQGFLGWLAALPSSFFCLKVPAFKTTTALRTTIQ
jgi:hypothetical protein